MLAVGWLTKLSNARHSAVSERLLSVLCAAKLHANQLERHLELLERSERVGRIIVVRHEAIPERLSKVENRAFGSGSLLASALRMAQGVDDVLRKERVDWVVAFNPVPWGSIAGHVARRRSVRTCLSLIGRDYQQVQTPWGRPFLNEVRRSDAVTVTGTLMVAGLTRLGLGPDKLHVLPHSVDLERFTPATATPEFDIVFVGQLIRRKRVDVLLQALHLLRKDGVRLTLAILGRGSEETALRRLTEELGLTQQVQFLGYRDEVEAVLRLGKCFALASDWEGVPFALMEALAVGLVPVVTNVGTIVDWVRSDENGLLVPPGDAPALAHALGRLATDELLYQRMRLRVLAERSRLSLEAGVAVWNRILHAP